jgi:2-iminobutanoate/2-iminopropanoate deaminase
MSPLEPHFAPTFATGDYVFVSGQLAFGARGRIEGDVERQTQTCLENLETLLRTHRLDRLDVVKTTVWLRSSEDYAAFNGAYARFFGTHRPARSTLICALALPEAVVEVEAIAATLRIQRGPRG